MTLAKITNPPRVFVIVWLSQMISAFGTGLTSFALGVFVYLRTGSTSQFALVLVFTVIPRMILSPFSGALADRRDRRQLMLAADVASGLVIVLLTVLRLHGALAVWQIYIAVGLLAIFSALRDPAYNASVSQLVPKKQLGRASGLVQTAENIGEVLPPLVAGALLVAFGLSGVLIFDIISYFFGCAGLAAVRFPRLERSQAGDHAGQSSMWRDIAEGWNYIVKRRGLLQLSLLGALLCYVLGTAQILLTPLVLSFASPAVLGATFSAGGMGILFGGIVAAAWGGFKRRVVAVIVFGLGQAVFLFIASLRPNAVIIAAGIFGYLFCVQFISNCIATILRENVPGTIQGRVFALDRSVGMSMLPLAYLLAGPLVALFRPWLVRGGALAGSAGKLIGVGQGRGIGFLFVALGVVVIAVTVISYANPRLRHLEAEMRQSEPQEPDPELQTLG
ncbi:MAG TPA: MFS transporter [Streptosporangiaceae bacterium]|nr:MFS transporter [Streptosporangiaceae bacterium]